MDFRCGCAGRANPFHDQGTIAPPGAIKREGSDDRILASDAKVSPVSVNIDARSVQPVGYLYRRPEEVQVAPDVAD